MSSLRLDIQALRGLAVSLVVLSHIKAPYIVNGYLGVDIFFVLSGFLITGILLRQLDVGQFSFSDFYIRRARRLFPAALVTVAGTAIGSVFFLNSIEYDALEKQILGALTFTINLVFWKQGGYFDVASESKPLLHMWSLAVEEQFYLLLPLVVFLIPKRRLKVAIFTLLILSLVFCLAILHKHQNTAFYLLPSRAWELLIGACGALFTNHVGLKKICNCFLAPAIAALLISPFWSTGFPHPGLDAVIVCVSTLIVILSCNEKVNAAKVLLPLGLIGNISYSLYLVHWPVIVFLNSSYIGDIPPYNALLAASISLVLALGMYRFVETPFRHGHSSKVLIASYFAGFAVLVFVGNSFLASIYKPEINFSVLRKPNIGLSMKCDGSTYQDIPECRSGIDPSILVWGDSFGMHSIPGLIESQHLSLRQATYSACAPLIDVAPYDPKALGGEHSKACINFNDQVLKAVLADARIKTVILGMAFGYYTDPASSLMVLKNDGTFDIEKAGVEHSRADLSKVIKTLQQSGKEVIVISSPPGIGNQGMSCIERTLNHKFIFGGASDCSRARNSYDLEHKNTLALYDFLERDLAVKLVRLSDVLCDEKKCNSIVDGVPIYRDPVHMSVIGSKKVFSLLPAVRGPEAMNIARALEAP